VRLALAWRQPKLVLHAQLDEKGRFAVWQLNNCLHADAGTSVADQEFQLRLQLAIDGRLDRLKQAFCRPCGIKIALEIGSFALDHQRTVWPQPPVEHRQQGL
jgi:hypothetical protein